MAASSVVIGVPLLQLWPATPATLVVRRRLVGHGLWVQRLLDKGISQFNSLVIGYIVLICQIFTSLCLITNYFFPVLVVPQLPSPTLMLVGALQTKVLTLAEISTLNHFLIVMTSATTTQCGQLIMIRWRNFTAMMATHTFSCSRSSEHSILATFTRKVLTILLHLLQCTNHVPLSVEESAQIYFLLNFGKDSGSLQIQEKYFHGLIRVLV